jgi:hypothetical protein
MSVKRLVPALVFGVVFVAHALYVGARAAAVPAGWTDFGIGAEAAGPLGLGAYWRGQDYFVGFSYALAAAFAAWALGRGIPLRQGKAAAGGVTLAGALMAGGCFLIGCCGSPMLAVYLSLLGAKALGLGKAFMALVTLLSVSCGYWCLGRRFARTNGCMEDCCPLANAPPEFTNLGRSKVEIPRPKD